MAKNVPDLWKRSTASTLRCSSTRRSEEALDTPSNTMQWQVLLKTVLDKFPGELELARYQLLTFLLKLRQVDLASS